MRTSEVTGRGFEVAETGCCVMGGVLRVVEGAV